MSVAAILGVENVDGPTMMQARRSWEAWTVLEPPLMLVGDLLDLREWTRMAPRKPKDAAIRALAKLASNTGGDDPAAVTALTWTLLPGATILARRLSDLACNIDELVASHLWTSARTFDWENRRSAAAAILRDARRGVLSEVEVGEWARRLDRTWCETDCVEPASPTWHHLAQEPPLDARSELLDVFDDAIRGGVITVEERDLLMSLAVAADQARMTAGRDRPQVAAPHGQAGLTGPAAACVVARQWGVTERSVRRRASKALDRLAAFSGGANKTDRRDVSTQRQQLALGA